MSNPYYTASGSPATGSSGSSAVMRAEFLAIEAGFDALPDPTGANNRVSYVNSSGTGFTTNSGFTFDGSTLTVPNVSVSANLAVTGTTSLAAVTVSSTLSVTGNLSVTGRISTADEYRLNNASYQRVADDATGGAWVGGYNVYYNAGIKHDSLGNLAAIVYHNAGYVGIYANSSQAADSAATKIATFQYDGVTINNSMPLTVTGNLSVNGNVTLGDAVTDQIVFGGRVSSDLNPITNATYTLGTNSLKWTNVSAIQFSDGYVTWGAAQFNRTGGYIELQYAQSAGVRIFGNGANPITFGSGGNSTFDGSVFINGDTQIGDASGDTLTINAGVWNFGNNYVATRAMGAAAAGSQNVLKNVISYSGDAGGTSTVYGWQVQSVVSGSNAISRASGILSYVQSAASGTVASAFGAEIWVQNAGGTMTNGYGLYIYTLVGATSTTGTWEAIILGTPSITAGGAITTSVGLQINSQAATGITTAYGIVVGDFTGSTNMRGIRSALTSGTGKYNLYIDGTADNYIAGRLGIGATPNAATNLTVSGSLANGANKYAIYNIATMLPSAGGTHAGMVITNTISDGGGVALTSYAGIYITNPTLSGADTVGTVYGVQVGALTSGTTNIAFFGNVASAANRWNLYMQGTAANYLAGDVFVGTLTDYGNVMVVGGTSQAITGGIFSVVGNETTGAINTGGSIVLGGHDGTTIRGWATIQGHKEDGTSGNYGSYLRFGTRANGGAITEAMRIHSDQSVSIGTTTATAAAISTSATLTNTGAAEYGNYFAVVANNASGANGKWGLLSTIAVGSSYGGTGVVSALYANTNCGQAVTVADLRAVNVYTNITAGTVTANYGTYYNAVGGGGTVTTNTIIFIAAQTVGSTIYGIRSQIAAASGRYNLYIDGTAVNYFAGQIHMGTEITSPVNGIMASFSGRADAGGGTQIFFDSSATYLVTAGLTINPYGDSTHKFGLLKSSGLAGVLFSSASNDVWFMAQDTRGFFFQSYSADAINTVAGSVTQSTNFYVATVASAVNYITVSGATTTNNPYLYFNGSDTNVTGRIYTKGSGALAFYGYADTTPGCMVFMQGTGATSTSYLILQSSAAAAQCYVYIGGTETDVPLGLSSKGTSAVNIYTGSVSYLAATFKATATSTVAVGIGTSAPASAANTVYLHIGKGDTTTYNEQATLRLQSGNAAGGARTWDVYSSNSDYTFTVVDTAATGYGIKIRYSDGSGAAGALYPITDSLADLGVAGSIAWRTLYVDNIRCGNLSSFGYLANIFGPSITSDGGSNYVVLNYFGGTATGASGDTNFIAGSYFVGYVNTQGTSDTIGVVCQSYFYKPTITVNTGDTVTLAATVYILNAPTEGSSYNWALCVASGNTYLGGNLSMGGAANKGIVTSSYGLGTISSGTVTPNPQDSPFQNYTNNGAHTLAPTSNVGSLVVDITNGASAGAITTSGFTQVKGDSFTTTNGHKFRCNITYNSGGSMLVVLALQ